MSDALTPYRARAIGPLAALALLTGGCATHPAYNYQPPPPVAELQNERLVRQPYDRVWTSLVDYASATFFGIGTYEKASGLMTLTFGERNAQAFVDCGTVSEDGGPPEPYAASRPLRLNGRLNLFVQPISPNETRVRVTARYQVTFSDLNWVFTSTTSDTQRSNQAMPGTHPARTCRSTLAAEREVLGAIDAIARR